MVPSKLIFCDANDDSDEFDHDDDERSSSAREGAAFAGDSSFDSGLDEPSSTGSVAVLLGEVVQSTNSFIAPK